MRGLEMGGGGRMRRLWRFGRDQAVAGAGHVSMTMLAAATEAGKSGMSGPEAAGPKELTCMPVPPKTDRLRPTRAAKIAVPLRNK